MKIYLPILATIVLLAGRTRALDGCITFDQEVLSQRATYHPAEVKLQDLGSGQKILVEVPPVSTGEPKQQAPTEHEAPMVSSKIPTPPSRLPPILVPDAKPIADKQESLNAAKGGDLASQLQAGAKLLKKANQEMKAPDSGAPSVSPERSFLLSALEKRRPAIAGGGLPSESEWSD